MTSRAGTSPLPACRGATLAVASVAMIPNRDERAAIPRGTAAALRPSGGTMSTVIDRLETRPADQASAALSDLKNGGKVRGRVVLHH